MENNEKGGVIIIEKEIIKMVNQINKMKNCDSCGKQRFILEVDIREGYKCWKCNNSMKIMLLYKLNTENGIKDFGLFSDFAYNRHPALIKYAQTKGIILENRYSKTINDKYIAHICPTCNALQGDNYVVEDNHQSTTTKVVERLRIAYCYNCKKYHEEVYMG